MAASAAAEILKREYISAKSQGIQGIQGTQGTEVAAAAQQKALERRYIEGQHSTSGKPD